MKSAQENKDDWLRDTYDEFITAYILWRKKSLLAKIIDILCGILLAGFMCILLFLIMLGSEYGGNG